MAKTHPAQLSGKQNVTEMPATQGKSPDELQAEIDRLRAENDSLKGERGVTREISLKVSEKGALSVYGMGRFPVTLYFEQWVKLLDASDTIRKFMADHSAELKRKEVKA